MDPRHQGAEPDPLGDPGQVRQGGVALQHGRVGGAEHGFELEEVVHHPHRVQPGMIGGLADGPQRGRNGRIAARPGEVGYLDADSHDGTSCGVKAAAKSRANCANVIGFRPVMRVTVSVMRANPLLRANASMVASISSRNATRPALRLRRAATAVLIGR